MKKNVFNAFARILGSAEAAPIDKFDDMVAGEMTKMSDALTMGEGLYEVLNTTHNYSFIESYSSRAAKEWESYSGSVSLEKKDLYGRFATLSCGVNCAIDAAKKMPKKGVFQFKNEKDIKIYSQQARNSGKEMPTGGYYPLLKEYDSNDTLCTADNSAMGLAKQVIDEELPMELGIKVDPCKRVDGDSYVTAPDAVEADSLNWDAIMYKDAVSLKNVSYNCYIEAVRGYCNTKSTHVARVFENELKSLEDSAQLTRKNGMSAFAIFRMGVKIYGAAVKDGLVARNAAYNFMVRALKLNKMNAQYNDDVIEHTLSNIAAVYLKRSSDNWLEARGNKYHAAITALFDMSDMIALFYNDWANVAYVEEAKKLEEKAFSFNIDGEGVDDDTLASLYEE